jgi:DALR anticodon binding domain/Arginyl tRNA synthetase N terminal domain
VIPADLGAELADAVGELVAAGHLPSSAVGLGAAGTWRPVRDNPAPAAAPDVFALGTAAPGAFAPAVFARRDAARYATSLPFELARLAGQEPVAVAARLGSAIQQAGWITSAEPTGAGYLTIGVSAAALAAVAVRISQAGLSCVRSDALQSVSRPVPPRPELAAALSWRQAWRDQAAALAGRLAEAAGATALPPDSGPPTVGPPAGNPAVGSTVADAVEYAGADAVRYWLARLPAARAGILDRAVFMTRDPVRSWTRPTGVGAPDAGARRDARARGARAPDARARAPRAPDAGAPGAGAAGARALQGQPYSAPPFLSRDLAAVRFAAADAAASGRWAAELGLARLEPLDAGQLGQPAEIELLTQLSWLAERVAGAARRRQPDELPRCLERLAGAWLDCREDCPALPFGGRAAPGGAAGISARLWLAEATATALAAGLDLVGVGP